MIRYQLDLQKSLNIQYDCMKANILLPQYFDDERFQNYADKHKGHETYDTYRVLAVYIYSRNGGRIIRTNDDSYNKTLNTFKSQDNYYHNVRRKMAIDKFLYEIEFEAFYETVKYFDYDCGKQFAAFYNKANNHTRNRFNEILFSFFSRWFRVGDTERAHIDSYKNERLQMMYGLQDYLEQADNASIQGILLNRLMKWIDEHKQELLSEGITMYQ